MPDPRKTKGLAARQIKDLETGKEYINVIQEIPTEVECRERES